MTMIVSLNWKVSTDFGSVPDRVTGPKALKPQGLVVRGLTCISKGTHQSKAADYGAIKQRECTRIWCRRAAGAYISCTIVVPVAEPGKGGRRWNTFVSGQLYGTLSLSHQKGVANHARSPA